MLHQANFLQSQSWTPCTGWLWGDLWTGHKTEGKAGPPIGPGLAGDAGTGEAKTLLHSCSFNSERSGWMFYLAAFGSKWTKMPRLEGSCLDCSSEEDFDINHKTGFQVHGRHPSRVLWLHRDWHFHLPAILQLCKPQTLAEYKCILLGIQRQFTAWVHINFMSAHMCAHYFIFLWVSGNISWSPCK